MGFFKDFKRDFAQAVNELMPDHDEVGEEYDDEDMVNTFDENDNMDIAPEDLLEDIDDVDDDSFMSNAFQDLEKQIELEKQKAENKAEITEKKEEVAEELEKKEPYANVPNAAVIKEHEFNDIGEIESTEDDIMQSQLEDSDGMYENSQTNNSYDVNNVNDELKALDSLDEENMMEGLEDAEKLDEAPSEAGKQLLAEMNFKKDIEDAAKSYEAQEKDDTPVDQEELKEEDMSETSLNSKDEIEDMMSVDTTYITKGTTVKGDLEAEGSIDVLGTVNGSVKCTGKLIIGGVINGEVNAADIYANAARVDGNVNAEAGVKIGVGSIIVGNVTGTSATISGAVNGDIDVHGPVIVDSTAVIMGNIKSRSVQINNGAVIEGFCSQCYSEIDVKSFFDLETENIDKTEN